MYLKNLNPRHRRLCIKRTDKASDRPFMQGEYPKQLGSSGRPTTILTQPKKVGDRSLSFCRGMLVSFSFLCCCSLYFSDTKCGLIFHCFWRYQTPFSSLMVRSSQKKRVVKDVRLSLPLTVVMKIVRLTSRLPDVLRLSSSKPRLSHSRRLAPLSRSNLTLNLCILSFVLSLALLPPLLTSPAISQPESWLRSSPIT